MDNNQEEDTVGTPRVKSTANVKQSRSSNQKATQNVGVISKLCEENDVCGNILDFIDFAGCATWRSVYSKCWHVPFYANMRI